MKCWLIFLESKSFNLFLYRKMVHKKVPTQYAQPVPKLVTFLRTTGTKSWNIGVAIIVTKLRAQMATFSDLGLARILR